MYVLWTKSLVCCSDTKSDTVTGRTMLFYSALNEVWGNSLWGGGSGVGGGYQCWRGGEGRDWLRWFRWDRWRWILYQFVIVVVMDRCQCCSKKIWRVLRSIDFCDCMGFDRDMITFLYLSYPTLMLTEIKLFCIQIVSEPARCSRSASRAACRCYCSDSYCGRWGYRSASLISLSLINIHMVCSQLGIYGVRFT